MLENEGIGLVSRQAYCKARQKIGPVAFKFINNWLINKNIFIKRL
jgi:hypothetical protein